ncbi:MAG: penicillin acylase family protein, partial [Gemmatimonadetes bacterium]|nr:penicillin acylase family protein [Gemmatimonadota bacterium]
GMDEPVTHRVRSTVRGPIITDVVPAGGVALSLLWTGQRAEGATAAVFALGRARDEAELVAAARRMKSPHQNLIYATTEGALGYRMTGTLPRRDDVDASLPISFERLPSGWTEFWPADAHPAHRDPDSDYLASANNLQSRASYGRVGIDYPAPFRARRIDDRLRDASDWTVGDMRDLQLDTHSLWGERFRGRAVAAARRIGSDALATEWERWDLRMDPTSVGAASFATWLLRLRVAIAADEFGDGDVWFPDLALIEIIEGMDAAWIGGTDDVSAALAALEEDAARGALELMGREWGAVHFERSEHPLGRVALLQRIFGFDVGPYPARGGRHTVRPDDPSLWAALDSTAWSFPKTGAYGPSERFVAHLVPGEPRGYFLLPTGQAGNPLDPHYRDMAEVWSESPLIELSPTGDGPVASRLVLEPSGSR